MKYNFLLVKRFFRKLPHTTKYMEQFSFFDNDVKPTYLYLPSFRCSYLRSTTYHDEQIYIIYSFNYNFSNKIVSHSLRSQGCNGCRMLYVCQFYEWQHLECHYARMTPHHWTKKQKLIILTKFVPLPKLKKFFEAIFWKPFLWRCQQIYKI